MVKTIAYLNISIGKYVKRAVFSYFWDVARPWSHADHCSGNDHTLVKEGFRPFPHVYDRFPLGSKGMKGAQFDTVLKMQNIVLSWEVLLKSTL